jgi:ubiquinol-cytochrome c reductase cytochrome b subunit
MKKEIEIKHLPMEEKKRLIKEGKMKWFFPDHVVEQIIICLFIFVLLITLATMFPPKLDEMADPFDTPAHIKPEWYFLAAYQFLIIAEKLSFLGAWAPKMLGIFGQGAAIMLLFLIPYIDRNPERSYAKRVFAMTAGVIAVIGAIALTIWGHFS